MIFGAYAQKQHLIAVGEALWEREKIAFISYNLESSADMKQRATRFHSIIKNDFSFYRKHFEITSFKAIPFGDANFTYWKDKLRYLCQIRYQNQKFDAHLYDIEAQSKLATLTGPMAGTPVRLAAHQLANKVYHAITQKKSIF